MIVLPWPAPLSVPIEPYHGPDWQTLVPPDSPDPEADAELLCLIYQAHASPSNVVQMLADYSEADWQFVQGRWAAIRVYHREYIIANPGCIAIDATITDPDPDVQAAKRAARQRLDRQTWLSRLLVATPRILAAAEYARIRRQIEPEGRTAMIDSSKGKGRGRGEPGQPMVLQTAQGKLLIATPEQPAHEALVPIGFVNGATPEPGATVAVPQIADERSFADVMETRGRRRAKNDIATGFEGLGTSADDENEDRG
jgi:hypothetical protein